LADIVASLQEGVVKITTPQGQGTGLVFDAAGLILTSAHVVSAQSNVIVVFPSGRALQAQVVGRHEPLDVAVLKVSPQEPLKALPFGDPELLRPGDEVVALGYPLGDVLKGSLVVTKGIVSAKRDQYIQTDTPINPGNSGGPLITTKGQVVGINTSRLITFAGRPVEGIGFALDISRVQQVLASLKAGEVIALPTPSPTSTENSTDGAIYRNIDYRYRVLVPQGWIVDSTLQQYVVLLEAQGRALVGVNVRSHANLSLSTWTELFVGNHAKTYQDFKELYRSSLSRLGVADIRELNYTFRHEGAFFRGRTWIFLAGDRYYAITMSAFAEDWEKQFVAMDRIANSFTFLAIP